MSRMGQIYQSISASTAPMNLREVDLATHLKMVKRVASHFRGRLPAALELADLVQAGTVGLMEALEAYDPAKGNDFETFAKLRIRGAMLDEIRKSSWAPRSTVKIAVQARAAADKIAEETGVPATQRQVAEALGLDVGRYHELRGRNQGLMPSVSVEEVDFASEDLLPEDIVEKEDAIKVLKKSIAALGERDRLVLALYYDEELTLKEIGAVIEVSESRVSQMLSAISKKLRAAISHQSFAAGS